MDNIQEYFPKGKIGHTKSMIYAAIKDADDGGLDRKSVLTAMDTYAQEFYEQKVIEIWKTAPEQRMGSPIKKAKEMALEGAIACYGKHMPNRKEDIVALAEEIYQWLIKEDKA